MIVYVNGRFVEEREATVSVHDRGFLYGDSVYETLRIRRGSLLFWREHERRLRRSCELAAFEIDWNAVDLPGIIRDLLARNDLGDARIRVTVSRGIGGPDRVSGFIPTWVVTAYPFEPPPESRYEEGISAVLVGVSRFDARSLNPEIKSGNFLNNLLARREAILRGASEGIMLSPDGFLAEGSMSNLFWVRDGILETPALSVGILHGVTRAKVLAIARLAVVTSAPGPRPSSGEAVAGLRGVSEVEVPPARLDRASEIFVTSTSLEVLPITTWEGRPVGSGRRGPVARALLLRLRALYPESGEKE